MRTFYFYWHHNVEYSVQSDPVSEQEFPQRELHQNEH